VLAAAAIAATLAITLPGSGHGGAHRAHAPSHVAASTAAVPRAAAAKALEPNGESAQIRGLIARGKPVYCGGRRGNEVALTFDDGPGVYTLLALRKLRAAGASATFFLVARNLHLLPRAAREERALGMVGDHTFNHRLLPSLTPAEAQHEIVSAQTAIARASGGPVFLFRPPYEAMDPAVAAIVRRHELLEILWDVDSEDSLRGNYQNIAHKVIAGLRPGTIALMHENHGQTIRALPLILEALRRRHLRAVSVPRLLSDDPPSVAQLNDGWSGCGLHLVPRGD
jgi:peptidoglycan/xylan/chitin deacetylase (PgdA/CDA1 family)